MTDIGTCGGERKCPIIAMHCKYTIDISNISIYMFHISKHGYRSSKNRPGGWGWGGGSVGSNEPSFESMFF